MKPRLRSVGGDRQAAPSLVQDIAVARRVIRAEIDGLEQMAETLDNAFGRALDLCAAVSGRLIVTGIGKSGHVARKIASTLASTGTPAQFVHAAEASHIMHSGDEVPLVPPQMPMSEAILVMTTKSFGCIGVRDDSSGRLVGVVTDGDLRRHMDDGLLARTVAEVMHPSPKTIAAGRLAGEALALMTRQAPPTTSLFVIDEAGRPTGFIHMHDCLRAGVA